MDKSTSLQVFVFFLLLWDYADICVMCKQIPQLLFMKYSLYFLFLKHFNFHCFSDRRRRNIRWGHGFWHSLYLLSVDQVILKFCFIYVLIAIPVYVLINWFGRFSFLFSAIFQIIQSIRMGMWVPVSFTHPVVHLEWDSSCDWTQSEGRLEGWSLVCWAGSSVQNYMTLSHMFTVSLDEGNTWFSTEPFLLLTSYSFYHIYVWLMIAMIYFSI